RHRRPPAPIRAWREHDPHEQGSAVREVLIVANRTLGGAKLLEAARARAADGDVRFRLIVPQSKPSAGLVIYDEAVRESAQVRVDLATSVMEAEGIETSSGEELLERLQAKAADGQRRLFIAVVPQQDGGGDAPREARARLAAMLEQLRAAGLLASGMIGDPDPYTATLNALELFRVDDV